MVYALEKFMFSCEMQKYRDQDGRQEARVFVVTTGGVYNIKIDGWWESTYLRRKIKIEDIDCLSFSTGSH